MPSTAHTTMKESARQRAATSPDRGASPSLAQLRARIDQVDDRLVELIAERCNLARAAGEWKAAEDRPLQDPAREAQVVRRSAARARSSGIDAEPVRRIFWCLIELSHGLQSGSSSPPSAETDPPARPRSHLTTLEEGRRTAEES